ncbi:MAG: carboxymuconolactone decarboxylase family protein [Pseudomonadota bacterium]
MAQFEIHDETTAPDSSRLRLSDVKSAIGFIPNLYGALAESPAVFAAYTTVAALLDKTSLTGAEVQVVLLTASEENGCQYCLAAHSGLAKGAGLDDAEIAALRSGGELADARLQALAEFTRRVVVERGWVGEDAVDAFIAAGFTRANVLDVILGVSLKTVSNYANHIIDTPIDEQFGGPAKSAA